MKELSYAEGVIYAQVDGLSHVNIYSRGQTRLGRDLSHFTFRPFTINGMLFNSLEAYWHWRKLRTLGVEDHEVLRLSHGLTALRLGRALREKTGVHIKDNGADFYTDFYAAARVSISSDSRLLESFIALELDIPFEHYMVRPNGKLSWHPEAQNVTGIYEALRYDLKN